MSRSSRHPCRGRDILKGQDRRVESEPSLTLNPDHNLPKWVGDDLVEYATDLGLIALDLTDHAIDGVPKLPSFKITDLSQLEPEHHSFRGGRVAVLTDQLKSSVHRISNRLHHLTKSAEIQNHVNCR